MINEVSAKIEKYISENENELISLLKKLVEIPTVNPWFKKDPNLNKEKEAQIFIKNYLEDLGAEIKLWEPDTEKLREYKDKAGYYEGRDFTNRPNLYAKIPGQNSSGANSILLFGHIDVVDVGEGWDSDPFKCVVKDGKIYGRGTADMKGGIAAMLMALKIIKDLDLEIDGDILFGSVVDEEAGGMGTLDFAVKEYKADAGILAEPTSLKVAPLCRGILWGKIIVRGKSGHIEMKQPHWKDGGAVDGLKKARFILDIIDNINEDWSKSKKHPLLPIPCQIIPAQINGGSYPTTYAEKVEIVFNAQYLPSEKDENGLGSRVKEEIEEIIKKASEVDSWLKNHPPEIEWMIDADCGEVPVEHPFINVLKNNTEEYSKAYSKNNSCNSIVQGVTSHTDMGLLIENGTNIINFGPGKPEVAHQNNENIELEELKTITKIITKSIIDWCGMSSSKGGKAIE